MILAGGAHSRGSCKPLSSVRCGGVHYTCVHSIYILLSVYYLKMGRMNEEISLRRRIAILL